MHGVYAIPIIHPQVKNVQEVLAGLAAQLQHETRLPIFFAIRSYQAWLEPTLEPLGWLPLPRQALMVKRLAVAQKAALAGMRAAIGDQRIEPTTPMVGFSSSSEINEGSTR